MIPDQPGPVSRRPQTAWLLGQGSRGRTGPDAGPRIQRRGGGLNVTADPASVSAREHHDRPPVGGVPLDESAVGQGDDDGVHAAGHFLVIGRHNRQAG